MMDWSPQCNIPSFMKIGLPVLEKKIFEGFYHIWTFENVKGRTTDGWTPDPWVSYKLTGEPSAQVS